MDETRIAEIERQLAELPVGYLVYKKIKGKSQPYLQWTENGHTVSKYIKIAEREEMLRKITLRKTLQAELKKQKAVNQETILLESLKIRFSVCKVSDYSGIDLMQPFCFTGTTDEEYSLVCPEAIVPENTTERDDGWRCFRITGQLDFSLIGILTRISRLLASNEIGIFAISTYNTDYILTKEENFEKALKVLKDAGYEMKDR